MAQFVPLAERIVDAVLESNPALASYVGDHRFDDRLPDLSTSGVAAQVAMLRDAGNALAEVDADALEPSGQVDGAAALVREEVPGMLAAAPGMRGTVEPVAEAAVAELDGFAAWLRS